jgi:hypothetical protein
VRPKNTAVQEHWNGTRPAVSGEPTRPGFRPYRCREVTSTPARAARSTINTPSGSSYTRDRTWSAPSHAEESICILGERAGVGVVIGRAAHAPKSRTRHLPEGKEDIKWQGLWVRVSSRIATWPSVGLSPLLVANEEQWRESCFQRINRLRIYIVYCILASCYIRLTLNICSFVRQCNTFISYFLLIVDMFRPHMAIFRCYSIPSSRSCCSAMPIFSYVMLPAMC